MRPGRAEYQALLAKVDAFAARAHAGQARWLQCRPGCGSCCHLRRTAWPVEIDHLRNHIRTLPLERQRSLRARKESPAVLAGERCVFLDEDETCAVYPARPLICRTHGPAVQAEGELHWCGLNFAQVEPRQVPKVVPPDSVLEVDRLNQLLALVNARFLDGEAPERAPLETALEAT